MTARYDAVAEFYEVGWPDSYDDEVSIALFDLVGAVGGLAVLDLACGHGRMTRELARRGAQVVGVDISERLLERARVLEVDEPLGIEYWHGNAAIPMTVKGRLFDTVVCSMGLADIDDLDGVLTTIAGALTRGAGFVFSILHPCFPGGEHVSASWSSSKRYYDEGWWSADGESSTLRQQVGANHRMLSTYLNALARHGFTIDELREPLPPQEWTRSKPKAAARPVFLVGRSRKM